MSYSIPTKDNAVAQKYTVGVNSIMNLMPFSPPEVCSFGGVSRFVPYDRNTSLKEAAEWG